MLVAGDGPARTAIRHHLTTAAPGRVTFLGTLPPARLAELYAAADLMVWPAHREAIAMTVLEAQAAGLPVIAGAAGAIPSIVTPPGHPPGGIITRPGDVTAMAHATNRLIRQPAQRATFARAARRNTRHATLTAAARCLDAILRVAAENCAQ